ncbi:hypothetical protein SAMN05444392_11453 [Seinonella peptonophila]|uniref:Uncharacterized protein n=1 Tax=Seinonella peptonophila TaxID=112248 RepID=A0A1M5AKC5_9BACL|nr:hypothetical protein [Seinonella peptonophila]SHF30567.1 hypothetical protein SAMN05444392_11453 [Seinonella peptonophila]
MIVELLIQVGPIVVVLLLIIWLIGWLGSKRSKKLSMAAKNGWLISHIFFFIIYFSGLFATLLLTIGSTYTTDPILMHTTHLYAKYSDWFLIIPGAFGCIITGVWLAVRTHWGLMNYYWVIAKTVGNVLSIAFGSYWMRVWYGKTIEFTKNGHFDFFHNAVYLESRQGLIYGSIGAILFLGYLVAISKFKPWGKRKKQKQIPTAVKPIMK